MKLLVNTEKKITKDTNGKNVPHLEITEVLLVHYNIANNDYQHDSRSLCRFVHNKSFGSLFKISPTNSIFLKTFNSEFSYIEVWIIKMRYSIEPRDQIYVKGYGFLSFPKILVRI